MKQLSALFLWAKRVCDAGSICYVALTKKSLQLAIELIPWGLTLVWVGSLAYFWHTRGFSVEQLLAVLEVCVWPIVVLFSLFFLNRLTTYLFFSLKGFNFFGLTGTLRPIDEVIEERVQIQLKDREDVEKTELAMSSATKKSEEVDILQKALRDSRREVVMLKIERSRMRRLLAPDSNPGWQDPETFNEFGDSDSSDRGKASEANESQA